MLLKPTNGKNFKNGCTYVKGATGFEQRDSHVEADGLQAGVYFFYVEMDWVDQDSFRDYEFSGTSYGPAECSIEEVTKDFPQHVVLKRAIVAESELGGDNIQ
jgi:beta-xylosidase